jgi:hypothetical protein
MKDKIDELTETVVHIEGGDLDPEHEKRVRSARMIWEGADTSFHLAFYRMKVMSPDDFTAIGDLRDAFGELEEAARHWKEMLDGQMPAEHRLES